ncbi:DUF4925 domain-containing protein [Parabacteroides sp. APC149_11_2_Y6]
MRKSVLYFCTLICSMCILTTSCSKDDNGKQTDDDTSWQILPEGDIATENVDLNLDGMSSTGEISFKALSSDKAQIELKNVIKGYSEVAIDLTMEKQADNSFNFSGKKLMDTAPDLTKVDAGKTTFLTVEVSGNITQEGKMTITVKTAGIANYAGDYNNDKLILNYSEAVLLGKTVTISADDSNMSFILKGVIPGESETIISGVQFDEKGAFSGETKTTEGTSIKYAGSLSIETSVLTLDLSVTLSETALGKLNGVWSLLDKVDTDEYMTEIKSSPFFLRWPAITVVEETGTDGEQMARVGSVIVSHILAEVLSQVTFHTDGNITAQYYPKLPFNGDNAMEWIVGNAFNIEINPSHTEWNTSPKNLAFWYTKNNKLYVMPNIEMIMKQTSQDNGNGGASVGGMEDILSLVSKLGLDTSKLDPALIEQVIQWFTTGIPLNYRTVDGRLEIYVDKEMVEPFMPILFTMLPQLQAKLDEMAVENPMIGYLPIFLAINKLTDIETIWKNNTKLFELGIAFKQNEVKE